MGIEYLSGIKPGDIIDLSKFDKKKRESSLESYLPFLNDHLSKLAEKKNLDFPDFLNSDNRIKIAGRDAEADQKLVDAQEGAYSKGSGKVCLTGKETRKKILQI